MKNRGFTLVEIMAVIAILGILLLLIVPVTLKSIANTRDKSYDTLVETIENGARLYVSDNQDQVSEKIEEDSYYAITLQDMINYGILKEDQLIDSRTDSALSLTKRVFVTKTTNLSFSYCYEDETCSSSITDMKPVITISGSNPVYLTIGDTYNDAGATVNDTEDGNLTSSLIVTSNVNVNIAGTYYVTYQVTDSFYNTVKVRRTIVVSASE